MRMALFGIADREGLSERTADFIRLAYIQRGLSRTEVDPSDRPLFMAYCTLGARSDRGLTALEHFEREARLGAEERSVIDTIKRGWFSVFEIRRIHLDRGFEVLDVLRRRKLAISERSATRQVGPGDLVLGWLCEDPEGTLTLEGGVLHVRALAAPRVVERAKALRDQARDILRGADWKTRAAELPPALIVDIMELRERGPAPRLSNTSGDPLQLATGRYRVRDRARVIESLQSEFEQTSEHCYAWLDTAQTLLAEFELAGHVLLVRVNSLSRLHAAKERLESLLGSSIEPSLDTLEGGMEAPVARGRAGSADAPHASVPDELPPELAVLCSGVIHRIRLTLDMPMEPLRGRTLRQAARSKRMRPDVIGWLREQERILRLNPQTARADMRPLWEELGLEYQGLDTDPPR